ncbi:MAG: protein kinase [Vicinamibacterales bacterium]
MTLTPGARLGVYEITAPLGKGGMGEVYRARDTRLGRDVALKILPDTLVDDDERRRRFAREARTVATLSHPHICTLYDVGDQDGRPFLVMELVAGETLAARLARGPVPLDLALRTAIDVAAALALAHRHGIVHRDLKPANVMLGPTGAKLLDFGIAAWRAPIGNLTLAGAPGSAPDSTTRGDVRTGAGLLLGTLNYMAPEQLEGRDVDARADIWALGALIYEMVAGARAFDGATQASVIAAILEREPTPLRDRQPLAPAALDALVRTCLEKPTDERWQSVADVGRQLRQLATSLGARETPDRANSGHDGSREKARRTVVPSKWLWLSALAVALAFAAGATLGSRREPSAPSGTATDVATIATWLPPDGTALALYGGVGISPDGHQVAFGAYDSIGRYLYYLRSFDELTAHAIEGSTATFRESVASPTWSPDGRWIAFAADGRIKKLAPAGGVPIVLAEQPGLRGLSWSRNDLLIFGSTAPGFVVHGTSGNGQTTAAALGVASGGTQTFPFLLPDGERYLFQSDGSIWTAVVGKDEAPIRITPGFGAPKFIDGELLFGTTEGLVAQRFDPVILRIEGPPRLVMSSRARPSATVTGDVAASSAHLVTANQVDTTSQTMWVDRRGSPLGGVDEPGPHSSLALSPDGRSVAVATAPATVSPARVAVVDLTTRSATVVTDPGEFSDSPVWAPSGRRLALRAPFRLDLRDADTAWSRETLAEGPQLYPSSWSPDGRWIVGNGGDPADLWRYAVDRRELTWITRTPAVELFPMISPNGKYLAYQSDVSGANEIYVESFEGAGKRQQISRGGGFSPQWNRDGTSLLYLAPDQTLMSVVFDPSGAVAGPL